MKNLNKFNMEEENADIKMSDAIDCEEVKGKLSDWIRKPEVYKWIRRNFSNFLRNFEDENGKNVYEERIHNMCSNNK